MLLSVPQKVIAGFGLASAILVGVSAASYQSVTQLIESHKGLAHTQEVLGKLEGIISLMKDAESGQRGYIITGQDADLKLYQADLESVQRIVQELRQLISDSPSMQRRLATLEPLISRRLAQLQNRLNVRKTQGFEAAAQLLRAGKGSSVINEIRQHIQEMKEEEDHLLLVRSQAAEASARNTIVTLSTGIFLHFAILSLLYYLIYREMTERSRTAAELKKQTAILQSVLDSMGSGVAVADEKGQFLLFNPAGEQILGTGSTDAKLEEWSEQYGLFLPDGVTLYPPEQVPLARAMRGERVEDMELLSRTPQKPDGVWLLVNATPLKDETGATRGGVAVFQDITERVEATLAAARALEALRESEARLREQATQLEQAFRELKQTQTQLVQSEKMSSLGQLVAGVAHEINNPVNFIYGNLAHASEYTQNLLNLLQLYEEVCTVAVPEIEAEKEAMDMEFLKEDLPKMLGSMRLGADRIRQIVLSLRMFSRLDEADLKPVDIHEGIDNTLLILNYRLKAKSERPGISVIKEYGNLPPVECYAGQLNQVFMNLLTNAIDALEEGHRASGAGRGKEEQCPAPTIQIRTEVGNGAWGMAHPEDSSQSSMPTSQFPVPSSPFVRISIADNGAGMSEEVLSRLFDPFFTTKPAGRGTGLGLSISHQIVAEKHGGALKCLSKPGQGAEFCIELPVRARSSSQSSSQKVASGSPLTRVI
ncbi:CHASE3 domain-containing protein [Kamptonema formosum]|uniref:CHASE3 domain-containing protein n=1 Tax=Kamptonema formosum TaxID=331992 RepID=UPI00034C6679|nr:CHASE3 domain-containing protein [Oscillatoria sp. PCC 10802]